MTTTRYHTLLVGRCSREALQVELLQEKASNLGRLARALERALEALSAHEREIGAAPTENRRARRRELLADAGDALFCYVVQREVIGLTGTAAVLDRMSVPAEVRLMMAPRSVLLERRDSPTDAEPRRAHPTGNTAARSRSSS